MLKKYLSLTLVAMLSHSFLMPVFAAQQAEREGRQLAKTKADVAALGIGEKAATRIKLRARAVVFRLSPPTVTEQGEARVEFPKKSELKGYISQAGQDSFSITDYNSGQITRIVVFSSLTEPSTIFSQIVGIQLIVSSQPMRWQ